MAPKKKSKITGFVIIITCIIVKVIQKLHIMQSNFDDIQLYMLLFVKTVI